MKRWSVDEVGAFAHFERLTNDEFGKSCIGGVTLRYCIARVLDIMNMQFIAIAVFDFDGADTLFSFSVFVTT